MIAIRSSAEVEDMEHEKFMQEQLDAEPAAVRAQRIEAHGIYPVGGAPYCPLPRDPLMVQAALACEIHAHLLCALKWAPPTDDPATIGHVRDAEALALELWRTLRAA
jgi:hypothetical protein